MIFDKNNLPKKLNKFIVIEGINGSGKTTLLNNLKKFFTKNNLDFSFGKEPGGTQIGDKLRDVVLSASDLENETEFFIMSASRTEYIKKVILPTINSGKFFISDRYYYSSLAFQSYAGGLDFSFVHAISKIIVNDCIPDITFILDVDLETAFKRIALRNQTELDAFESKKLEYHTKVRNGYLDITKKLGERFYIIDASKDEDYIANAAANVLKEIYKI
ncbi:MAG: dTMP kinase [Bdellovibrionota bacterium]